MSRGSWHSDEGSGVKEYYIYGDRDKMMTESDAAYEDFEAKWMDCLEYSTSNFTKDSEEPEDDGERVYCTPIDEGGEEDDDTYIFGTEDENVNLSDTIDREMSIDRLMLDYSINPN